MSAPVNPYAFPVHPGVQLGNEFSGMTLRDWFAGQVMSGTMANGTGGRGFEEAARKLKVGPDAVMARAAFLMADAMLAEREQVHP